MIQISDKTKCCGCTACENSCPKKCISMQYDEEGFLYPVVNVEQCVNCGLCEKVCPEEKLSDVVTDTSECYAIQNLNKNKRMTSTAGGAFSLIADYLLEEDAVVFAVGYDNNMVVCHKMATDSTALEKMRGPKYVQSNLDDTFSKIKDLLKENRKVLFVGTPCQTHGLFNYIGENDNLYIIDLLCLGVSSPKLFAEWIDYLSKKYQSAVINVQFRNKHYGYSVPNVRVFLEDGKEFDQRYDSRVHANLFFQHLNVRPSCYVCKYRERPRISDFTVGDYNNIGSVNSNFDDDFGTTKLWVHTQKGKDILEHIQCNCKWYLIQANGTNIVGGQKKMYKMPEGRESFFRDAQNMEYLQLVRKWEPYNVKGFVASIARPIVNLLPFKSCIFKALRKRKIKKFQKRVEEVNL